MKILLRKKKEKLHFLLIPEKGKERLKSKALRQLLSKVNQSKRFSGRAGETLMLSCVYPRRNLEVAVGTGQEEVEDFRKAGGRCVLFAKQESQNAFSVASFAPLKDGQWLGLAEGILLANYSFCMKKEPERKEIQRAVLHADKGEGLSRALNQIEGVCQATLFARDLGNTPANICTPRYLAGKARGIARQNKNIRVRIIDQAEMKKMGMNALLGVAAGSKQPPYLIVLEYKASKSKPYAIVGKGITFDSGGISLKPSQKMDEMKFDMSGAGAVLGLFKALAQKPLPVSVVGVAGCTENLPSGSAQKPGDIVKTYAGKTVEILNTDAEGRLVLADALSFVEKTYDPEAIIDLATLTGACVVSLGHHCAGLLGTDDRLLEKLERAGQETGERLWRLPLWPEYQEEVKSKVADVKNITTRGAGAITAGCFLRHFVGETPWAHIDIAGTAWDVKGKPYIPQGATGFGVRLLYRFLEGEQN